MVCILCHVRSYSDVSGVIILFTCMYMSILTMLITCWIELCQNHSCFCVGSGWAWKGQRSICLSRQQPNHHEYWHPVCGARGSEDKGCSAEVGPAGHWDHHQLSGGHCQVHVEGGCCVCVYVWEGGRGVWPTCTCTCIQGSYVRVY